MTRTRLRLRSKIGFTLFVAIVLIAITFTFNTFIGSNDASSMTETSYITVQVAAGDTLWQIASQYSDGTDDIRYAVYRICEINDMTADQLYAGTSILIPEDL